MSSTARRAAPPGGSLRPPAKRSDGRENRHRLAEAAGELLHRAEPFALADVATAAGLSTATAYRHFRSAEDATEAFVGGFWDDMDARVAAAEPEVDLRRFCGIWVRAVLDWGPALVQLRSREGFLARRASGDVRVARLARLLEPPLSRGAHRVRAPAEGRRAQLRDLAVERDGGPTGDRRSA